MIPRPFRSLREQPLRSRYRFFRANCRDPSPVSAMRLAQAEAMADDMGLTVVFRDELTPWCVDDGSMCEPALHLWACVNHPDTGEVLAEQGGIALASWRDPFLRVVEAELLRAAIDAMYSGKVG